MAFLGRDKEKRSYYKPEKIVDKGEGRYSRFEKFVENYAFDIHEAKKLKNYSNLDNLLKYDLKISWWTIGVSLNEKCKKEYVYRLRTSLGDVIYFNKGFNWDDLEYWIE